MDEISDIPHFQIDNNSLSLLELDRSVKRSPVFIGGYTEARKRLDLFLSKTIKTYADDRNEPSKTGKNTSNLSPYLHFGHISPVEIALITKQTVPSSPSRDSFLEELIIRRELSFNMCYYNDNYDNYNVLPNFA